MPLAPHKPSGARIVAVLGLLVLPVVGVALGGAVANAQADNSQPVATTPAAKMQTFKGKGPEFWHWRYVKERAMHGNTGEKARIAQKALKMTLSADLYGTHWIERAFMCIHSFEGSWQDPNAPYYGGLQMDEGFQRSYGREFYDKFGTADKWPISVQLAVGIKAYLSGRGFGPWPNTARYCGLR